MAELASQPTSIQSLYGWYSENRLFVNRRYQRKLVWTLIEKQRLIESITKKYPIPAILIAERGDGSYEIIDGLQRLHAIVSFIEGAFQTINGSLFNLDFFSTAKGRLDAGEFEPIGGESLLTQKEVSTILDYSLALSVMRGASEEEIDDVFGRINTYGHRLSDQERRQAGVQNEFSELVRALASTLRGDATSDVLSLRQMPSISIDLPMAKHGYEVKAEEVFWVNHGILRSTDLRDSMDEQCVADIAACIISGNIIQRSKDALDEIYTKGNAASDQLLGALEVYGKDNFKDEFKFCVDEILKSCATQKETKLRDVIFKNKNTNPFQSTFAAIMIAFHELIVREGKAIANYPDVGAALTNLAERIDTSRGSTSPEERRKNVDTIKGLISPGFVVKDQKKLIYGNHTSTDIDTDIRRSEIELANYELKQGMLRLDGKREVDDDAVTRILKTICAIANNGSHSEGKVILGVADKDTDAERVAQIDGIAARKVGKRQVVGVSREAKAMGISTEAYFTLWRDAIKNSGLSEPLKSDVLSNIDFNSFFGLGVIVIRVPSQKDLSYFDSEVYSREADQTVKASTHQQIANAAKRFVVA